MTNKTYMNYRKLKRLFDIIMSIILLFILSPIYLILSLLVYLTMGRPILFRQLRPGLNGKLFTLVKFRTMLHYTENTKFDVADDIRLTPFGKFLRSTSLDELPELWNVLKGEMSLVGPRPLLIEYLPLYSEYHSRRHEMLPGITGLAQINGRNRIGWDERLDLDIWYIDNWSLGLDTQILFKTICRVLLRDGINQPGQATMKRFTGSSRRNV